MEVEATVLAEEGLIEKFIENPQQFLEDLQKDTMQYNALLQMSGMKATEFDTQTNLMIQVLKTNPEAEKLIQQTLRDQFIKEEEKETTLMKSEDIFKPRMVETRRLSIQGASTAVQYGPQALMFAVCTIVAYFMF